MVSTSPHDAFGARPGPTSGAISDTPALSSPQGREESPSGAFRGRLSIRALISIRWLVLASQTIVILGGRSLLHIPFDLPPCLSVIAAGALFNLISALSPLGRPVSRAPGTSAQLAIDLLQVSAILYFTGGVANPFALLLIAPVTIAAATLPLRYALLVGGVALALSVGLIWTPWPIPWIGGETVRLPRLYSLGVEAALLVGILVTGGSAFWAAREAARMELALRVSESVLAREQRLSALGGLAAAAAHELGTPLATISVVAKELARETPEGPLRDDAWLLVEQAQRCRDILRRLAETPETTDVLHERMTLLQFVREVMEPYAGKKAVRAEAVVTGPPGMAAPDLWRRAEVLHAITSFVENAYDFARAEILVTARFDATSITIEVRDDGPGFAPAVLARLGGPYVTSRPGAEGSRTGHVGMGLGFFIAKTLLERTGARVDFRNGRHFGAIVSASWPRSRMEALEPGVVTV